jgi:hypothetical protein
LQHIRGTSVDLQFIRSWLVIFILGANQSSCPQAV